ncbi:hypothetical protein WJX73_002467 [Symbiochloris irregularis]|uniref:NAD(P)-binding protein n=1 Tax=Symbiochloris irregularis TaxID=706552 RepID=A0AAW1NXF2_9CHLO
MPAGFVIVTGGNRGLGLDVCHKLVTSGRNVILASRDARAGQEAAAKIRQGGGSAQCVSEPLDVSSPDNIKAFARTVTERYAAKLEGLINCAATYNSGWDHNAFTEFQQVNYAGPVMLTQLLAPALSEESTIVMVTSGLGHRSHLSQSYASEVAGADTINALQAISFRRDAHMAGTFNPCYCLTKAMLNRSAHILATDPVLKDRHININSQDPGWCRTRMGGGGAPRSSEQGAQSILMALELKWPQTGGVYNSAGQLVHEGS